MLINSPLHQKKYKSIITSPTCEQDCVFTKLYPPVWHTAGAIKEKSVDRAPLIIVRLTVDPWTAGLMLDTFIVDPLVGAE